MSQRSVYIKQEDEPCLSKMAEAKAMSVEKLVQTIVHEHCRPKE